MSCVQKLCGFSFISIEISRNGMIANVQLTNEMNVSNYRQPYSPQQNIAFQTDVCKKKC